MITSMCISAAWRSSKGQNDDTVSAGILLPFERRLNRLETGIVVNIGENINRTALVFLVAGQSNAGGCGVISPELHRARGNHIERPLVPDSTAKEMGLSTNREDYTHSYIWVPGDSFQRIDPNRNAKPDKPDTPGHGIELPLVRELEKRFPEKDIFVIKYGPGAVTLHRDWNPALQNGERPCYATWLRYYSEGMAELTGSYPEIRVIGLYWDQGESDGIENRADEYAANLTSFIATVRKDTGIPQLPFFIRKHVFDWDNIDAIIAAQEQVVASDPLCHLLDIDLGDQKQNYDTWAYSPNNGHVSSRGFVELSKRLFEGPLADASIDSFCRYEVQDSVCEAIVFLIAGQSNAGGVAAFSAGTNERAGMQEENPTNPGTTAEEVGIPTAKDAYPRSYIWKPKDGSFERLTPEKNLQTCYQDPWRHGIELPMAMLLEQHYPNRKIYFVKHGPGGHNLYSQWAARRGPDYTHFIAQYRGAMTDLKRRYAKVRVAGLYWDQGESDCEKAGEYEKNLGDLFAALREDTGIADLRIYVRKHLFHHEQPDFAPVIEAQHVIAKEDTNTHLLDLDLGSNAKNFRAWAWSVNNGHLGSRAYLELSTRIMKHLQRR